MKKMLVGRDLAAHMIVAGNQARNKRSRGLTSSSSVVAQLLAPANVEVTGARLRTERPRCDASRASALYRHVIRQLITCDFPWKGVVTRPRIQR